MEALICWVAGAVVLGLSLGLLLIALVVVAFGVSMLVLFIVDVLNHITKS